MLVTAQGSESQNRSVEGDEVALRILPPCAWWVFKRDQLAAATKAAAAGSTPSEHKGADLAIAVNAASPSPGADANLPGGKPSCISAVDLSA